MNDPDIDRSLIEAARAELGPSETERRRLRRSVATAVGAAVGATAASAATASATTAGAATTAAVTTAGVASWKVGALVVTALAVTGGVAWTVAPPDPPRPRDASAERVATIPTRAEAPSAAPEPARDEPLAPPITDDLPPEPTITPAPEPERQPAEEQAAPRPVRPRITAPAPAPPALAEEHTLIAETALLRSAHRALREGAPDRALALLNTHSARYPRGALREECAATRVLALCALDRRAEAQAEIAAFLAAYPNSMHTARVRAACAAP